MILIALLSAIIGLLIIILVQCLGKKIRNRWLRYASFVLGIIVAMGVAGNIPLLLGHADVSTSSKAGEFMFYGLVILVIANLIFSKKKTSMDEENESTSSKSTE